MKIREIRCAGLRGATPEGGWSNELRPEDCVHTLIAVHTDEGAVGLGSVFTNDALVRAALAVLDILESDRVIERNRATAALIDRATAPLRAHPRVAHWRQRGMIWAFDVPSAGPAFARDFFSRAVDLGVLLRPLGNTVYWMPPYVFGEEEVAALARALCELMGD